MFFKTDAAERIGAWDTPLWIRQWTAESVKDAKTPAAQRTDECLYLTRKLKPIEEKAAAAKSPGGSVVNKLSKNRCQPGETEFFMKKALIISLILTSFPFPVTADTIIFADGIQVDADRVWESNGEVKCEIGGIVFGYPN
jgi:hypothetical protein